MLGSRTKYVNMKVHTLNTPILFVDEPISLRTSLEDMLSKIMETEAMFLEVVSTVHGNHQKLNSEITCI